MLFKRRTKAQELNFDFNNNILTSTNEKFFVYSAYFQNKNGNFGDKIIPRLGIDLLQHFDSDYLQYKLSLVRDQKDIDNYVFNKHEVHKMTGLIIGPGGMITGQYKKTKKHGSKWFLNFDNEQANLLKQNNVPIFFWATGVNHWSAKRPFNDEAKQFIIEIFEKIDTAFLRGNNDIECLKSFLPNKSHEKLIFQPCPSLFLQELRGIKKQKYNRKKVAINIATDHLAEFYDISSLEIKNWKSNKSKYYSNFANQLIPFINYLKDSNFEPVIFCNTLEDTQFAEQFLSTTPRLSTYLLDSNYYKIEDLYSKFDFAVGMRLHAWLPFLSLNTPAIFLSPFEIRAGMPKDLNLPELGCFERSSVGEKLIFKFKSLLEDYENLQKRIENSRNSLWNLSGMNAKAILDKIKF